MQPRARRRTADRRPPSPAAVCAPDNAADSVSAAGAGNLAESGNPAGAGAPADSSDPADSGRAAGAGSAADSISAAGAGNPAGTGRAADNVGGVAESPSEARSDPGSAVPGQVPPGRSDGGGDAGPGRTWRVRVIGVLSRHRLVCVLLAAGLVMRVLTQVAYHPALIYVDSLKYLYGEYPGSDPLGYRVPLRIILLIGDLGTVAAIQHVLGLALAVALYAVLLRCGAARWLAAIAVAPVLLDAYQLQMEHMIMPDVWFEAMLVAGLAVLLWRPAVSWPFAVAAGLILGSSATVKQVGEILILPAVLYLLAVGGGWRRAAGTSAVLAAAFLLPILGYSSVSYARTGHFWLSAGQSRAGRMAAAADCATLKLPAAVRPLCPTPAEQAQGPDWLEHSGHSPLHAAAIPPGANRAKLISALTSAVEHQQPARVVASIARDSLRLFAVTRTGGPGVTPIARWQFQTRYPTHPPWVNVGRGHVIVIGLQRRVFGRFRFSDLAPSYGGAAQVNWPAAAFLRFYQLYGGYAPGPLLALCVLAGLAGSFLALTRRVRAGRSRRLALACLLFTATTVAVLLAPDVLEFSWRYQLPAVVFLPPAGVLGASVLLAIRQARRQPQGERVIADEQTET